MAKLAAAIKLDADVGVMLARLSQAYGMPGGALGNGPMLKNQDHTGLCDLMSAAVKETEAIDALVFTVTYTVCCCCCCLHSCCVVGVLNRAQLSLHQVAMSSCCQHAFHVQNPNGTGTILHAFAYVSYQWLLETVTSEPKRVSLFSVHFTSYCSTAAGNDQHCLLLSHVRSCTA